MHVKRALLIVLALGACSPTEPEPAATPTTDGEEAASPCRSAEPNEIQAVEAVLAEGYTLGPATVASHPEGQLLIADILEGEERVSSADVWLLDPPSAVPVSSSAEEYSTIPRPDNGASIAGSAPIREEGCYSSSPR